MSAASSTQFAGQPPSHAQMNAAAGASAYNYPGSTASQHAQRPATSAAGGTPLTPPGPMSQPPPRKLDPDQMPSPVSVCLSIALLNSFTAKYIFLFFAQVL